ncbi:TPA: transposase [Pasteurella multocida]|nr:transposase [Pasteurella multocida]
MWLTTQELLGLPFMPKTTQGITFRAKQENWQRRRREGVKGNVFEYHLSDLPEETQKAIRLKFAIKTVAKKPKPALPAGRDTFDLRTCSQKQISISDARMAVARYVLSLEGTEKGQRRNLIELVCDQVKLATLPEPVLDMVRLANAKPRNGLSLSPRTLYDWVLAYEKAETPEERLKALVPKGSGVKKKEWHEWTWMHDFLPFYQTFTGVTVAHAYKRFIAAYDGEKPSLYQVRRVMSKVPEIVLQRGRLTGAAYSQKMPVRRRDWEVLGLFDVYVGDGHGFKAKIRHPDHAHGFQPEVTAIIDGRTRYLVGWSLAKSESVIAVGDALRHAIERCGLPLIYYSDNGGGEKNKRLDCEVTGLFARLGITHKTGRPGNPQGRGIIERLWETTLIPLAREYETSVVKTVDKSTAHLIHRKIESAVNALEKGKELTAEQRRFYNKMPRWEDFIADVERVFEEYNRNPHSELPKKVDGTHFSPLEYREWIMQHEQPQQRWLTAFECELLFRPEEIRTVARAEIELFTNRYSSTDLAEYHGEKVKVGFDIHDPSYVIVKTLDGRWICRAELNGNKSPAFAQSVVEQAREKSIQAANKRLEKKIERNSRELQSVHTIEEAPDFSILVSKVKQKIPAKPIFHNLTEKEEWEAEQAKLVNE